MGVRAHRRSARSRLRFAGLALLALTATACFTGVNHTDPLSPRYAGPPVSTPQASGWRDTLRVVSFNVENGEEIDSALVVLTSDANLVGADVILLQEMDEGGVARMAGALGMGYVYYPAILRKATGRNFGNAVLSRWPIIDDEKLILPYRAVFGRTQRIATVATIRVGGTPVRVYSVHLATPLNVALRDRQEQMATLLRDAASHPHVIIGGDFNSGSLGSPALERGYAWPTRDGPRTIVFGRFDHIFFKGLIPPAVDFAGTVEDNRGASDHLPVWALGVVY